MINLTDTTDKHNWSKVGRVILIPIFINQFDQTLTPLGSGLGSSRSNPLNDVDKKVCVEGSQSNTAYINSWDLATLWPFFN
jgi:hypothetical protein